MIIQLSFYLACLFIGWVPLYALYRYVERTLPLKLTDSVTRFSLMPLLFVIYAMLEVGRGVLVMYVVHEWLLYDVDLIIGVILCLLVLSRPPFIPKSLHSSMFFVYLGMLMYVMPEFIWVFPLIIGVGYIMNWPPHARPTGAFLIIFLISLWLGMNSLYNLLFGWLVLFSGIQWALSPKYDPSIVAHNSH